MPARVEYGTRQPALPLVSGGDVPPDPEPDPDNPGTIRATGWRTEITRKGRYYVWRKGSHNRRQSAPGGKFSAEQYGTGYADRLAAYGRRARRG